MKELPHVTLAELEARLDFIRQSPKDCGKLELIGRRPQVNDREMLEWATLDSAEGLVGDNWKARGSKRMADGSAHPDMQLTLMNSRAVAAISGDREHWVLAGDQLFVDLDLSAENLSAGTRLEIGETVIEVTSLPHTGCKKFLARFGQDALDFVNSPLGRQLQLRGINAKVVRGGVLRIGDPVRKVLRSEEMV